MRKAVYCFIFIVAALGGFAVPVRAQTLSTWTSTTSYPTGVAFQSCVVNSGYVYCVGDYNGSFTNAVYYAPLSSSGVGSWTATTSYPTSIESPSCVVNSGYVYCVGGYNGSDTNVVYYAPLSSSGVGSWTSTTSYPASVDGQGCVVNSGYVYCAGGYNGSYTNAVYYAGTGPPTPSNLSVTTLGASSITWAWNAVSGATSYDFYPSTGGAPINLSGTTFTQTNLSTNTSYGAQVSALNSIGPSLLSTLVSTYTFAAPPTSFVFTQVNVSSVTVAWSANGNPTSTTSYRVEYWQPGGSTTSLTTTATQETITGLSIATTYYLTLSALNGNGIAAPSGETLSTTTFIPPSVSTSIGSSGGVMIYNGVFGSDNLQIPAGAYSQNVQVTLQTPDQSSLACNASPAENLTPTDIALEVDLNPAIEPTSPVTVSLSYANASIGSMNPEQFLIARCDPTNNTWTPLHSTVDSSAKSVTATSDHLSIFQIMSGTPPTSVSQYKVGPNPLRPALGESQMKFVVPPNSDIKIYTLTGELVNDITAAPDGTASWNATNRSGRAVASGVYFVLIRGNGHSKTIKVIVER